MSKMSELDAALQVVLREMDVLEKQRAELEQVMISVCSDRELHKQVFNILFELSRVEGEIRQALTGNREGRELASEKTDNNPWRTVQKTDKELRIEQLAIRVERMLRDPKDKIIHQQAMELLQLVSPVNKPDPDDDFTRGEHDL